MTLTRTFRADRKTGLSRASFDTDADGEPDATDADTEELSLSLMQMDVEVFDMRMLHLTESYTRTFGHSSGRPSTGSWKRTAHVPNARARNSHAFPEVERALNPDTAPATKPLDAA